MFWAPTLCHSAKGSTWGTHKYIMKIGKKYIYKLANKVKKKFKKTDPNLGSPLHPHEGDSSKEAMLEAKNAKQLLEKAERSRKNYLNAFGKEKGEMPNEVFPMVNVVVSQGTYTEKDIEKLRQKAEAAERKYNQAKLNEFSDEHLRRGAGKLSSSNVLNAKFSQFNGRYSKKNNEGRVYTIDEFKLTPKQQMLANYGMYDNGKYNTSTASSSKKKKKKTSTTQSSNNTQSTNRPIRRKKKIESGGTGVHKR